MNFCFILREINFLYDEKTSPHYVKHTIDVMVLHEVAHMWFGNIVSPEWYKFDIKFKA
jgi:aminopeptidase N